ncbi:MAG: TetR/AcrR family transcriptional regulator [Hyphomicrobium sp.]|jgi:AcrR family transcriptional regulator
MLDQLTTRGRLVAAAMKLAAECPWREVTLVQVAESAGVSLVDVRRDFANKGQILAAFVRLVDDAVLARAPRRSGGQPPRDALFEVVMSRFDVLAAYKPALQSIAASFPIEPSLACAIRRSQAWMLRAAGIRADGPEGHIRALGLGTLYASVYRTWLRDDDPGLSKTMAELDRGLRRGERTLRSVDEVANRLCRFARCCCGKASGHGPAPQNASQTAGETPTSPAPGAPI